MTKEYIFKIAEEDSDYEEVFYGWIRKHSPELIRCENCQYYDADSNEFEEWAWCKCLGMNVYADFYCEWAERRSE